MMRDYSMLPRKWSYRNLFLQQLFNPFPYLLILLFQTLQILTLAKAGVGLDPLPINYRKTRILLLLR
jgi:hypothetical protein